MWQEIEKTECVFLEHKNEIKRFRPSTNRQSKPKVLFQVFSTKYSKGRARQNNHSAFSSKRQWCIVVYRTTRPVMCSSRGHYEDQRDSTIPLISKKASNSVTWLSSPTSSDSTNLIIKLVFLFVLDTETTQLFLWIYTIWGRNGPSNAHPDWALNVTRSGCFVWIEEGYQH